MEFGSLGHHTWQWSPSSLAMHKNQKLERFNLSTCGRVEISESNPEQTKWYKWGSRYIYIYIFIWLYICVCICVLYREKHEQPSSKGRFKRILQAMRLTKVTKKDHIGSGRKAGRKWWSRWIFTMIEATEFVELVHGFCWFSWNQPFGEFTGNMCFRLFSLLWVVLNQI